MLLTGASQPPIKIVRIQPSRRRLVDLRRLRSRLHASLQRRAGMYRPPGCAAAGTDLNAGFGFVAAQRRDHDRRIRDGHQLMQAKLTDHPRPVAVGAECLCHGRQRELGVRRPGQHARVVDAVITKPQKIRTQRAFPHPGAVRWVRDTDPEQGVRRHRSGRGAGDPMAAVVPGGGGQQRVRFGRVLGVRRVDGVGGVQVGVERQRVVGVALQRPDAVVMRLAQRVADGVGQQRVRADLHEGAVLGARRGDGLAEPHRVTQVGHPILGIESGTAAAVSAGGDDTESSAAAAPNRPAPHATRAVSDQWSDDGRPRPPRCAAPTGPGLHHRDHRIDLIGRPGDHGLARRGIHRHAHLGVVGDQRLGGCRRPTPAAPSRPARPAAPSTSSGWRSPATPRPG